MSKRISRLASSVQNPPACWRDKSATFTVLPNQGERHPVHLFIQSNNDCETDCEKPKCYKKFK